MATYIAPISWGLGDLVVSLQAVQALIERGETYLIARSDSQAELASRVEGLAGTVAEKDFDASSLAPSDVYLNLRNHPLQKNYWWGSPEFEAAYPGYKINDCLKTIARDFGLLVDWQKLTPLSSIHRENFAKTIIFIAGSDGDYKNWPKQNWLELESLLIERGYSVVVIGQPHTCPAVNELLESGLQWIDTPQIGDAIDVISSSVAVVGVDTGLSHLSVNQGIQTTMLYRSDPIFIRDYPNCHSLMAKTCPKECLDQSNSCAHNEVTEFNQWTPKVWRCALDDQTRCMSSIDARTVSELVTLNLPLTFGN